MKRKSYLLFIVAVLFLFISCEKEQIERSKNQNTTQGEGVAINMEPKTVTLDSTKVTSFTAVDTIVYENSKYPLYEINVETTKESNSIQSGTVVWMPLVNSGGALMLVYDVTNRSSATGYLKSGIVTNTIKAIKVTIDWFFNEKNQILQISTPGNRSKTNSTFPYKLPDAPFNFLGSKISLKEDIEGISLKVSNDNLCTINVTKTLWQSPDKESSIKVVGDLFVKPSFDVFMEFKPTNNATKISQAINLISKIPNIPQSFIEICKLTKHYVAQLNSVKTCMYTDIDNKVTISIHLKKEYKSEPKKIPIGELIIPTEYALYKTKLYFEIDFNALGVVNLDFVNNQTHDFVLGLKYNKGDAKPEWHWESKQTLEFGYTLNGRVELGAGIYLVIEPNIYLLGVLGPHAKYGPYIAANGVVNVQSSASTTTPLSSSFDWKFTIDAFMKGSVGFDFTLFGIDELTENLWESEEYKSEPKNLYTAPHNLKIIEGNNQAGILGKLLPTPIKVGAYDNRDNLITFLPVPVYFEPQSGSVNPSGMLATTDGFATTNWTLGRDNPNQLLKAYFKDGDSKKGEVEIAATAANGTMLNTPTLLAPANGAANQPISPTLKWQPASGASSYTLQVADNANFESVKTYDALVETSKTVSGLGVGKTYYWKVSASSSTGDSPFTAPWSFTTASGGTGTLISFGSTTVTNISGTSATLNSSIASDGGSPITQRGFAYVEQGKTDTVKVNVGSGTGSFSTTINGLTQNITYNIRAFATNSTGTTYGTQVSFTAQASINPSDAFITKWDLPAGSFTLPLASDGTYNCTVDWGDGTTSQITNSNDPNRVHSYGNAGIYQIAITGTFNRVKFGYEPYFSQTNTMLTEVVSWGNVGFNNFENAFSNCSNLKKLPESSITGAMDVKSFYACFYGCFGLKSIPIGLFSGNPNVTNFGYCFSNCSGLTSIPEGLFSNSPNATIFHRCFSDCTSLISIPEKLFFNNPIIYDFQSCFSGCTSLTSIPEKLFSNNSKVVYFGHCFGQCSDLSSIPDFLFSSNPNVNDFNSCFSGCTGLTTIPENLFSNNQNVTTFAQCFGSCTGLKTIPVDLFSNNRNVTDFEQCFQYCTNLTTIPEKLFYNNPDVTTFARCFEICSLTSIPENLFINNYSVTTFSECFRGFTGSSIPEYLFSNNPNATDFSSCFLESENLKYIPEKLFNNNPNVIDFSSCFYSCTKLLSIPEGLFSNNPNVTNFNACFRNCVNLTSIPENIFIYNSNVFNFSSCFQNCSSLKFIPIKLFNNNHKVSDFSYCFSSCILLSGNSPELWLRTSPVPDGSLCFHNCTGLSNYATIPNGWK